MMLPYTLTMDESDCVVFLADENFLFDLRENADFSLIHEFFQPFPEWD